MYLQTFQAGEQVLQFDTDKSILLCKVREDEKEKVLWAKKLNDIHCILEILGEGEKLFLACEIDDIDGKFLALDRSSGSTLWYIPGRPYFQVIFDRSIFIIFVDSAQAYYLLRVDTGDGKKIWYHRIAEDLCEYSFNSNRILLRYESGRSETLNPVSGEKIYQKTGGGK